MGLSLAGCLSFFLHFSSQLCVIYKGWSNFFLQENLMKELDPSIVAFLRSKKRFEARKPAQDPEPMKVDDDADGRQSDDHQDVQPV